MNYPVEPLYLKRLSSLILEKLGIHFQQPRWCDMIRSIQKLSNSMEFDNLQSCVNWILDDTADPHRAAMLAKHVTIGETYFFRDDMISEMIRDTILPKFFAAKSAKNDRNLVFWSAGCSSGEEAYTLAILLAESPPSKRYDIDIIGSDVNANAIAKARQGIYTKWSFRNTPQPIMKTYFEHLQNNHYKISDHIRDKVQFLHVNLVEHPYPDSLDKPGSIDVIFCRHVLMYLDQTNREIIVSYFVRLLSQNGWLIVSPAELPSIHHPALTPLKIGDVYLFQKNCELAKSQFIADADTDRLPMTDKKWRKYPKQKLANKNPIIASIATKDLPLSDAHASEISIKDTFKTSPLTETEPQLTPTIILQEVRLLLKNGQIEIAIEKLHTLIGEKSTHDHNDLHQHEAMALLANTYANQGSLDKAEYWYRNAIAADKLRSSDYYFLAIILLEKGEESEAIASLKTAIFINPEFILAHLQLAAIFKHKTEGKKYANNVLSLATKLPADSIVPFADGMSIELIRETARKMML